MEALRLSMSVPAKAYNMAVMQTRPSSLVQSVQSLNCVIYLTISVLFPWVPFGDLLALSYNMAPIHQTFSCHTKE